MSDAIDNAEAMLSCISLAYKESASEQTSAAVLRSFAVSCSCVVLTLRGAWCPDCRLEAQYGHQQDVDMIPLKVQDGYKAKGWLGLILGTRMWYRFYGCEDEDPSNRHLCAITG